MSTKGPVDTILDRSQLILGPVIEHYQGASLFEIARDAVFFWFVARYVGKAQRFILGHGPITAAKITYKRLARRFFVFVQSLPYIREKVEEELGKVLDGMEKKMIDRSLEYYPTLPEKGWDEDKIFEVLDFNDSLKHSDWEHGRVSGAVYHGGAEMLDIQAKAYQKYSIANQLHPDVFPGVRKMESEVVSMVLKLYNAPESGCGTSTSGGTESLLLACLSARQKAYHERGITEPEIIAPVTIHAGFDKAAYYFNIKLVHAPVDPVTYQVDLKAVRRLVNRNTILIAGSAPNYPHGIIDDIQGLSKIALRYKIPLHVDACLGSFVVPFLNEAGYDVPIFDFRVPGVTSISCDTHKYGFAPKGSSIIMYRDPKLRTYQYFVSGSWSGGVYASPTLAGSRPGALMVGCWASLMKMGRQGYLESCKDIVGVTMKIKEAVRNEIDELYVLGDPVGPVVAFSSKVVNIYDLSDAMSKKGWHLAAVQNPAAIHVACTRLTVPYGDELIRDLKECVTALVASGTANSSADGSAALYGVAGSVQTAGVVERIAEGFVDNLYRL